MGTMRDMRRLSLTCFLALACAAGCSSPEAEREANPSEPGRAPRDQSPDGLYHDFLDGKYDGAGHPLDAQVWEAERDCDAHTGVGEQEGIGARPGEHATGTLCAASSEPVGQGRFILNLRAMIAESADEGCFCGDEDPVFTVRLLDDAGEEKAKQIVVRGDFESPNVYRNVRVPVVHDAEGPVRFEITWNGAVAARLDYVELFRARRAVVVEPPSGVLEANTSFRVELLDPPEFAALRVSCDGVDRTGTLDTLIASGDAMRVDTDYRAQYTIPADPLLEDCPRPTRVMFQMVTGDHVRATSRVTAYAETHACSFTDGTKRVLLTGFEPFPADSSRDNSSEYAVTHFNPSSVPGVSVMSIVLPVEFDTAAGMLRTAILACQPDVIIGFGQGRSTVDLETTAYNRKESATFSGGIPDNRGMVAEGSPIIEGATAELASGLPLDTIHAQLEAEGIAVDFSDDPGRYVCNNLFYRLMTEAQGTPRVAGFIHLPRIPYIESADAAMLQTVVQRAVEASVAHSNP